MATTSRSDQTVSVSLQGHMIDWINAEAEADMDTVSGVIARCVLAQMRSQKPRGSVVPGAATCRKALSAMDACSRSKVLAAVK